MDGKERHKAAQRLRSFMRHGALGLRVEGLVAQLALGTSVVVAVTFIGWALRNTVPGASPSALLFPAILVASLVGGWRSGATAAVLGLTARTFPLWPRLGPLVAPGGATAANFILFGLAAAAVVAIGVYPRTLLDRLRRHRDALREQSLHYRTLFETIPEGFAICDGIRDQEGRLVDYTIVEINPALRRLLGVGPEVIGSRLTDARGSWSRWLQVCDLALSTGRPVSFERYNRANKRWHEVHISRLTDSRMAQFFFDITERKANEARQAELFEELNHRVKNNLAMVSSLLQLQARGTSGQVRDQLLKAASRVQSIAEVHDSLSRGDAADRVDFGAYLQDLCASLRQSLAIEDHITLKVETQTESLSVETAVSLGMVVNELVTNAVKYAYPVGVPGVILVGFSRDGDWMVLTVRDHGRGLQEEIGPGVGGLGMRLVRSLLEQLGGDLRIQQGKGAGFEIRLPAENAAAVTH